MAKPTAPKGNTRGHLTRADDICKIMDDWHEAGLDFPRVAQYVREAVDEWEYDKEQGEVERLAALAARLTEEGP